MLTPILNIIKLIKHLIIKEYVLIPFKKWYVKGYTNKSDSRKIVNHILGFTNDKLNKNLMIKLNNSKITNINFI